MDFEKLKKNRTVIRAAVTKITNAIEGLIKVDQIHSEPLEEQLNQLHIKAELLKKIDEDIEPLLELEEYEKELVSAYEYAEKISNTIFRAQRKLKEIKSSNNSQANMSEKLIHETKHVKLPKLNIQKFYGDCTQFYSFYNTFKISIHENETLSKTEKFNYLKSYLGGPAANAIAGFEISDENYDSALQILKERFGKKDVIINSHMNKLLNLSPVYKITDIPKLKRIHNEIEVNVRCLSALGLESNSYSAMLLAVVLKIIPHELALEYNRQNKKISCVPDINQFLNFLQTEILTRERTYSCRSKSFESNSKNKNSTLTRQDRQDSASISTSGFFVAAKKGNEAFADKKTDNCLFCKKEHDVLNCRLSVEKKRNVLKNQGRCFLCLGLRHRLKDCLSGRNCKYCSGKHNENICYKFNNLANDKSNKESLMGDGTENVISAVSHMGNKNRTLLQTSYVLAKNENLDLNCGTRVLLDCGSMRSFTTQNIANKLKCKVLRKEKLSVYTFGSKTPIEKYYDVIKLTLINRNTPDLKIEIELLVTDEISGSNIPPPEVEDLECMKQLKNLTLADFPESKEPITILIGADYYYNVVTGNIKHLSKTLVAVETIFGWCLQGKKSENNFSLMMNVVVENSAISEQIQKFWDLETSGLIDSKQDADPTESEIMRQFESQVKYENKRYTVGLPWKLEKRDLKDNRKIAEERFSRLRKRFYRNPELYFEYKNVIEDYLRQKIIEPVINPDEEDEVKFYLPHREIIRKDRETSKLRIVFDASSHDSNCLSLNDCLHIGPNLYSEIFDILLRFRFHPIAYTTDMKQAFLQISLNEEDRDVTRFFFTDDPSDESIAPQVYKFTRVLFRISSSPFLLAGTLKYHLKQYTEKYPVATKFLNDNIYVDDIIGSHASVDEALSHTLGSIAIFEDASLSLHKWRTNSKTLRELWKKQGVISSDNAESLKEENMTYKVLGIAWDNLKDILYFDVGDLVKFVSRGTDTKRYVLQVLGRIFDPIGILGPFTVRIKCLMQQIWALCIDWDDRLPEDLSSLWRSWCEEVPQLTEISIPRHYFSENLNIDIKTLELHFFCDASMKAFGTVAYMRALSRNEDVRTAFVASKNRFAPIKSLTLPRLELMAAVNPSDTLSRGAKVSKLLEDPTWLTGPQWLKNSPEYWPKSENDEAINTEELEYRKKSKDIFQCECLVEEKENPINITKFSNMEKLVRITAWVKKSIMKFRKISNIGNTLTAEELIEAENHLIRLEQKIFFKEDYESLKNGEPIQKDSDLFNFLPFMDENEIIRLGGRLEFAELSTEEKHPIILPKRSWLTFLIAKREHEKVMHGGTACTLARIRQRFWIPKGRQLVKSAIKKCLICQKYLSRAANQIAAPLPLDRSNTSPPFSVCGLDFAGPIYVKIFTEVRKSYIVLFTCAVTRSIHLELVSDMTTDSFLLALRRFLARRGNCKVIYSDNAKTFKRARKEIEDLSKIISDKLLSQFLTKERIVWKNIVERAAWWGGFYERLVKSVKDCLRKIVGKALLNFEEMSTLLTEIETVLNLRPLTYVYNENSEPLPLTPMHFLNFGREPQYPINFAEIVENESKRSSLLKRKKYQSLLLRQLWIKWKQQHLLDLRTVHSLNNPNKQPALKIGDVVLIEEDSKNKLLWKLGKIKRAFLGRDNNVRSYEVKTASGLLRRTIQHLYPLEL
ncbi:uncharacterized protein LOC129216358 [Uloborus diversus]|uniref:uncharacterized protein LOC129216358 n=1 Tax=Uloborus diversus TaxID=327109 RepID=UPI0024099AFB|nr:uncharacterized protein LOC129216358 [Uloborus diversus]